MEPYKQYQKSLYKGYVSWGQQIEDIQASAIECRVAVDSGDYQKVPMYVGLLGALVNELRMPTKSDKAKNNLRDKYMQLKRKWLVEQQLVKNGKSTIDLSIIDEIEIFHDDLIDHIQEVGQGIPVESFLPIKKSIKQASGKRDFNG